MRPAGLRLGGSVGGAPSVSSCYVASASASRHGRAPPPPSPLPRCRGAGRRARGAVRVRMFDGEADADEQQPAVAAVLQPPPPPPPTVLHSSSFLLEEAGWTRALKDEEAGATSGADAGAASPSPRSRTAGGRDSLVETWLRRADETLDAIERKPSAPVRAAWSVGSEVGKVASRVLGDAEVQKAAQAAAALASAAVKTAVPLGMKAGQWALTAAFQALMSSREQERGGTLIRKRPRK